MKKIIILGAGFGGIAVAKSLLKQNAQAEITLIDQNSDHIIHGNLYEVATSPEELTRLGELKRCVAVPLQEIFQDLPINIVQAKVEGVDLAQKIVKTVGHTFTYDYLVSALGAGPNYFAIPGAKEFSLTLLSATDALRIRSQIETAIQVHKSDYKKKVVNIVVAGGGVAGVEVSAELQKMIDFLAWENNYPRLKVITTIIERSQTVLSGFPKKVIRVGTQRLQDLGIKLQTNSSITRVEHGQVYTDQAQLPFDVLIWTAGVSANGLPGPIQTPVAIGKRIEVNEHFQLDEFRSVYVIGDQCCRHDSQGNPLPGTASQAIDHARFVAQSIALGLKNRKPLSHSCKSYPFVIPLGGKWAIFSSRNLFLKGRLGYLVRQLVWLRYFVEILGLFSGIHWWLRSNELFSRND